MSEFDRSLARVLIHEGGFSNNPKDPGGATMKGITQRVYNGYLAKNKLPTKSVQYITDAEVSSIYREQYWDATKCDELPVGVSYVLFDGNVNSGPTQSVKWLQRALGVTVDGQIGMATIAAANAYDDPAGLIIAMCDRRLTFMKALKTWSTFGRGWAARVDEVKKTGVSWANAADTQPLGFISNANAKASIVDAKKNTSAAPGDAATGGGAVTLVLTQVQDQLSPYTSFEFVGKVVAGISIFGAVVMVVGFVYRLWAKNRTNKLNDALDTKVTEATA